MSVAIRYAVRSDKGLVRGNNEDSVYAGPRLIAIADGMGGHAGGEVASRIVIGALEDLDDDRQIEDLITALREAVGEANDNLSESVGQDPKLDGMGTTLTAMRFDGSKIGLVHIGDSRGYLLRDGQLAQITHDDTYVQSLVDSGRLTADEAMHHPRKSVILRALNGSSVDPDVSIREAIIGDRYLLCSDGLTDVVRPETLQEALGEGDPQECADRLVALALRGGGPDNVTVVVADVVGGDDGDDVPVAAGAVVDAVDEPTDDDSPAGRAANLESGPAGASRSSVPKERRWRRVVFPFTIVVVLVAGTVGTWLWTQNQYFVGRSQGLVTVFQGVNTALGPVKFYSVVNRTDVRIDDLSASARSQVADGITAQSRSGADAIVARLVSGQLLPICSIPSSSASSSASPSVSPSVRRPSGTLVRTPPRTSPTTPARTTPAPTFTPSTAPSGSTGSTTDSSASATARVPGGPTCRSSR